MKVLEKIAKNLILKAILTFNKVKPKENLPEITAQTKVLFIRLHRAGDGLVCTPLIHKLKEKTGCSIYVLADKKNSFVFENNFDIDKIFVYPKKPAEIVKLMKQLNDTGFDIVVDLHVHDDVSTTVSYLVSHIKSEYKFGMNKGANSVLFTNSVPLLNSSNIHVIERVLEIGKLFSLEDNLENVKVVYNPTERGLKKAAYFVEKAFTKKKFLLGINISAGSPARFWGAKNFSLLVGWLKQFNINVIIISTTRDLRHTLNMPIEKKCVFYTPDFDEFASIISKLDMLFSPDTATIHIASAYKIPVFGLYVHNATNMLWTPYQSDFDCIQTKEPTLENVTFQDVINKFQPFLEDKIKAF